MFLSTKAFSCNRTAKGFLAIDKRTVDIFVISIVIASLNFDWLTNF